MATYNGHKNWNHWNVSLWLNNDEGLYALMVEHVRSGNTLDEAARSLLATLHSLAHETKGAGNAATTPDGAPYTLSSVRAAMRGVR